MHKDTRQTYTPTTKDWKTTKRIVQYLKISKDMKLHLKGVGSDVREMELLLPTKLTIIRLGFVLTMDGADALWLCKKQPGVSLSKMEHYFILCRKLAVNY